MRLVSSKMCAFHFGNSGCVDETWTLPYVWTEKMFFHRVFGKEKRSQGKGTGYEVISNAFAITRLLCKLRSCFGRKRNKTVLSIRKVFQMLPNSTLINRVSSFSLLPFGGKLSPVFTRSVGKRFANQKLRKFGWKANGTIIFRIKKIERTVDAWWVTRFSLI